MSWVRFHLDGSSADTYSRVHQVPKSVYYKVIENIGNFTKRKKEKGSKISIGIGSVALYENFSEVSELARLTKRLGLDYFQYKHDLTQMTNSEYMTWWNSDVTTMLQELSCELESSTFKLQFSNNINYEVPDLSPFCHIHHMNTAITADGRVGYCKSLRNNFEWSLGNINNSSLKSILDSDKHIQLKKKIIPATCGVFPCPYKQSNILIEMIKQNGNIKILAETGQKNEHSEFI